MKEFINLQPQWVFSSVGLERMLDRHEVGSSNLPRPTKKEAASKVGTASFFSSHLVILQIILSISRRGYSICIYLIVNK